MKPVIGKVFTSNVSESVDAKLIAVYRLNSLIDVMKKIGLFWMIV